MSIRFISEVDYKVLWSDAEPTSAAITYEKADPRRDKGAALDVCHNFTGGLALNEGPSGSFDSPEFVLADYYHFLFIWPPESSRHPGVSASFLRLRRWPTESGPPSRSATWSSTRPIMAMADTAQIETTFEADSLVYLARRPVWAGFSDVFRAHYAGRPDALVAVKRLRFLVDREENATRNLMIDQAFRKEVAALRCINHRHILRFLGVVEFHNDPCIVTPWMGNGTLLHYLALHQDANRAQLLCQVASALQYLHSGAGLSGIDFIIHGDIHVGNVLIDDSGSAVLSDFGLCKMVSRGTVASLSLRLHGTPGGVPAYIAPELRAEGAVRTLATDVFAFGILVFAAYAGASPKLGAEELKRGIRPRRDEMLRQDMSDRTWRIARNCWAQAPLSRPSMAQVCVWLETTDPASDFWLGKPAAIAEMAKEWADEQKGAIKSYLDSNEEDAVFGISGVAASSHLLLFKPVIHGIISMTGAILGACKSSILRFTTHPRAGFHESNVLTKRIKVSRSRALAIMPLWEFYETELRGFGAVVIRRIRAVDDGPGQGLTVWNTGGLLATIRHQNILPYLGTCTFQDTACLVSPLLTGDSLGRYIVERVDHDREHVLHQIAQGLSYLHDCRITHGSLHPWNVLLSGKTVQLSDFGLWAIIGAETRTKALRTAQQRMRLMHQAPEIHAGAPPSDPSDVYSFGMLAFSLYCDGEPMTTEYPSCDEVVAALGAGIRPERDEVSRNDFSYGMWAMIGTCWRVELDTRPTMDFCKSKLSRWCEVEDS